MHIGPPIKPPRIDESDLQYRAYFLDGAGRIRMSREFYAESDEAAIELVEIWREGEGMELWCRDRQVKTWP